MFLRSRKTGVCKRGPAGRRGECSRRYCGKYDCLYGISDDKGRYAGVCRAREGYTPVGILCEGQPAISVARTKDGWLQIYYIGIPAYIHENVTAEYKTPEPVLWQNVEIQGDIKINALGDSFTYGDKLKTGTGLIPI